MLKKKREKEKEQEMFYFHCLLSRKGPLGTIWIAAHCPKKLKKDQVTETDISSSVDKIMLPGIPFAFRALGHLLIGIVRIYSKKVDYLYHDCNEVSIKLRDAFASGKLSLPKEATWMPYFSITLPEKFELDAFNLEDLEDDPGSHVRPNEQITLKEVCADETSQWSSRSKMQHHLDREDAHHGFSTGFTLAEEVFPPLTMDVDLELSYLYNVTGLEASTEKLLDNQPTAEEYMKQEISCGAEESSDLSQDSGRPGNPVERIKLADMTPPDLGKSSISTGRYLQVSTPSSTPDKSNFKQSSVTTPPEVKVIPTPTKKEQVWLPRKRKQSIDETMVVSNETMRQGLHDSSSLVRKRRKLETVLHAWKVDRISNLQHNFLEPLIPCCSLQLKALFKNELCSPLKPMESLETPTNTDNVGYEKPCKPSGHKSPSPEGAFMDPSTPTASAVDSLTSNKKEVRFETSDESGEELSCLDNPDFDPTDEEISFNKDCCHQERWSIRTRAVAQYLHNFVGGKKQKHRERSSLASILEGRTRTKCARLFYEILVLKTRGFINVQQEDPYSEILVLLTKKIESLL